MGLSFHAAVALAVSFWSVSALCGQGKQPEVELYERARQSLAGKKLPDAEAALQDLLKVNPKSVEGHFLLGALHSQKGEYAIAERLLLQALQLRPKAVPVLNNLGVNALHLRREQEAEQYFRRVLSIDANDNYALFNLGLLELKRGRFSVAAEHLRKAAVQRAGDLPLLQALLAAELELGRRDGVAEAVRQILQAAPGDPRFYAQLAAPLVNRGFDEAALLVLERGLAIHPQSSGEIHTLLGDVYEKRNQYDRAVEEYQTAVHLSPENEQYYFNLGYEFLIHHNFDLAERIFSASIRSLPRAPRLRLGLSAAYFGRAQYEEAVQALKEAFEIGPESESVYFMLGRAHMLLSDRRELFEGESLWT
jgi:Flp pilus assembly protein TadD